MGRVELESGEIREATAEKTCAGSIKATGAGFAYVTGATGFVGSHLVERLLREGWRVRALVLEGEDASRLAGMGVECVRGNLMDGPERLRKGLAGTTHVFHSAAWVDDWAPRKKMAAVNVHGMRNVLEALEAEQVKRFVMLGSITVYGDRDQVNQNEDVSFLKTGDSYNFTKVECERALWEHTRRTGLAATVLRPSYIYGRRDNRFFPGMCRRIRGGWWVYLAEGKLPIQLVSVENVAEACVLAATRKEAIGEGFIITDGEAVTRRELVEMVCEEMGYEKPTASLPRGVGKLLCPIAEWLSVPMGWKEPFGINRFLYHFAGVHLTYDIGKAKRLLGYEPRNNVRSSLRETAKWFRENRPDLAKHIQ